MTVVLLRNLVDVMKMVPASNGQISRSRLLVKCVRSSKWSNSLRRQWGCRRHHMTRKWLLLCYWELRVYVLERGHSTHMIPDQLLVMLWSMIVRDGSGRVSAHYRRTHDIYTLTLVHKVYLIVWKGQAHLKTKAVAMVADLGRAFDNRCTIDGVLILISAINFIAIVDRATFM